MVGRTQRSAPRMITRRSAALISASILSGTYSSATIVGTLRGAIWRTIRSHTIRPHVSLVWDEQTERELDDSDD
ncbi:uncharacterized protein V1513DRAFT_428367 [Lipomyces chichibuensis]|uniref:uncharacterized protein n=1 Tax=Lipomyces chichibuensis TaxID=1546026 RepID=UPI0033431BDB